MLVRNALGVVCASVLVTAGYAPAYASGDENDSELTVEVCKEVKNGDEDKEFHIDVSTDEDDDEADLADGDCETFTLTFDDNKFVLEEDVDDDWDVDFEVSGDDEETWSDDGELKVRFDEDEDEPSLEITVVNEENGDEDHDNGDKDHDNGDKDHDNGDRHHDDSRFAA